MNKIIKFFAKIFTNIARFFKKIFSSICRWFRKMWKKYKSIFICFFVTIPLVTLGVIAMIFLYTPQFDWQKTNKSILFPIFIVLYILVVEFIAVIIPLIMIKKKEKKDKTLMNETKQ